MTDPQSYVPPPVPPSEWPPREQARIPLHRWIRIPTERPIITQILLVVIVLIFIPMALFPRLNLAILDWGALQKLPIIQGEWWRLITAAFLHGGLLHIGLNGYALYMIGMDVEGFFGRARFMAIYALSALAGSAISFIFLPGFASGVGASGAIFGLIGALAVYFGINRGLFGRLGQAQFWNIIVVIVLNVAIGFSGIFPIDNSAHLGGLLVGAAAGFILCPRYETAYWRNPLVLELENKNRGRLPWLAVGLLGMLVAAIFIVAYLLYRQGYLFL